MNLTPIQNKECLFYTTHASTDHSAKWSTMLRRPKSPPPPGTGTRRQWPSAASLLQKDSERGSRFRSLALQGAEKIRMLQQREKLEAQQELLRREAALEQRRQTKRQLCERYLRGPLRLLTHFPARASVNPPKPILKANGGTEDKSLRLLRVHFGGSSLSPAPPLPNGEERVEKSTSPSPTSAEPEDSRPSWLEQQVAKRRTWNLRPQVTEAPPQPVYFEIEPPRHDSPTREEPPGTKEPYLGWTSFPNGLKRTFEQRKTQLQAQKQKRVSARPRKTKRNRVHPLSSETQITQSTSTNFDTIWQRCGLYGLGFGYMQPVTHSKQQDECRHVPTSQEDGRAAEIDPADNGGRLSSGAETAIISNGPCWNATTTSSPLCPGHHRETQEEMQPSRKRSPIPRLNAPDLAEDGGPNGLMLPPGIPSTKRGLITNGESLSGSFANSETIDLSSVKPVQGGDNGIPFSPGRSTHDLLAPEAQITEANPRLMEREYLSPPPPAQRLTPPSGRLDSTEREIGAEVMDRVVEMSIPDSWPFSVPEDGSTNDTSAEFANQCAAPHVPNHSLSDSQVLTSNNEVKEDKKNCTAPEARIKKPSKVLDNDIIFDSPNLSVTTLLIKTSTPEAPPLLLLDHPPPKAIKNTLNQQLRSHSCRKTLKGRKLPCPRKSQLFDGVPADKDELASQPEDDSGSECSTPLEDCSGAARGKYDSARDERRKRIAGEKETSVHGEDSNSHRCIHQAVLNRLLPAALVTGLSDLEQLRRILRTWRNLGRLQLSAES